MSGRKFCANPLCRAVVDPDAPLTIELYQRSAEGRGRRYWVCCGLGCAQQYLALCELTCRARQEHAQETEA
jgi:hypothetical protein